MQLPTIKQQLGTAPSENISAAWETTSCIIMSRVTLCPFSMKYRSEGSTLIRFLEKNVSLPTYMAVWKLVHIIGRWRRPLLQQHCKKKQATRYITQEAAKDCSRAISSKDGALRPRVCTRAPQDEDDWRAPETPCVQDAPDSTHPRTDVAMPSTDHSLARAQQADVLDICLQFRIATNAAQHICHYTISGLIKRTKAEF